MRRIIAWCVVAVASLGAASTPPPDTIHTVQIVVEGGDPQPEVAGRLGLEAGEPLDRRRLREGILALYAEGHIDTVRVIATPGDDGLDIRVEVAERARIASIVFDQPEARWRRRARRWANLEPNQAITRGEIEAAAARIARRMREDGWANARVEPYVDYDRPSNSVVLTFEMHLGEPQVLVAVEIDGLPADETAVASPEVPDNRRLTDRLEERMRDQVEAKVRDLGYWEGQVTGTSTRGSGRDTVLEIRVDPGPRYILEIVAPEGAENLVREAVPDPGTEDLHPAQTEALADGVRLELQRRGYLLAHVEAQLDSLGQVRKLTVTADPGTIRRVTAVEFPGVTSIDEERLRKVTDVHTGRASGWRGQRIDDDSLDDDRRALLDLYRRSGFPDATIAPAQLHADGPDGTVVSFAIDESRRWSVVSVRVDGFPADAVGALDPTVLDRLESAPWDPRLLESIRRQLDARLFDLGYPDARVTSAANTSDPGHVAVAITAEPGAYVVFGQIVVAGLERTRESVVDRNLRRAGLVGDTPYSRAVLLDAQRRLYELGLFRRIEIVPIPGQERRRRRGVVVRIEEADQRSYLVGLGWDNVAGVRATLGWSHLNLFGGAHAVSAEIRYSSREERWQLGLREPRLPRLDMPAFIAIYRTEEDFDTWSQRRRGISFEIGDRYRRPWRSWYRYEYQIVEPDAPDEILSDLERQQQRIRIAAITPNLERDTRDDPLLPSRGSLASMSLEWAFPSFTADANYLKLQGAYSSYHPFANGTLAFGIRTGAIEPLATEGDAPPNLQIPIAKRFFSGGRISHRAFATDRLGVPGQTLEANGDPIGGNALVILNFEYQRPIRGILSGVLFVDAGNVWARPSAVDVGDIRWGAGLGLRVATPAGPLRLEYGYKLDRKAGESPGEVFLSFGVPF